ncbi:MAG: lysophospholipid acyltransferase family protein [Chitinophagales bacterium]
MNIIKNILGRIYFAYAMVLFIITLLVIFIPVLIISFLPDPAKTKAVHKVFRLWMGVYMPLVFCPVIRTGKRNFKKGQQYVVVINHNSLADIPVSSPWIPGPNKTLGKVEMTKIPLFSVIYKAGAILVDRKNVESRRESFAKMQETLDMGIHLCLYPEGTRNKTNEPLQPFFDGAFITAVKAQKPVIPGIIFNTAKILPNNKKLWARPMPIRIDFLKPIPTEGLTLDDVPALKEQVHSIMATYYIAHKNNGRA